MEKPSQKEMREEVLHLLKTNPDASYTIIEIMDELTYEPGWKPTVAKIVSTLKADGTVTGEKKEGETAMTYSIHEPEQIEQPDQPESNGLTELVHEYHIIKPDSNNTLLHEGFGSLKGAINMAETIAKQKKCDVVIQRIETITVGIVKTTVQTEFQPIERN